MSQKNNKYVPLDQEIRSAIPTDDAAFHLCLSPQTLRVWACYQTGSIKPVKVNGRLLWPVAEIIKLIQGK